MKYFSNYDAFSTDTALKKQTLVNFSNPIFSSKYHTDDIITLDAIAFPNKENEEINIYNVGVYPLQDYWDSTDLYVDIVGQSSLKGFQEKFNTIANEEMNLFLYHHQKNKKENDIIYTGSSLGKIRKYGLSEQKYMLNLENSKKFESPVLCFDVKQNMKSKRSKM